MRRRSALFSTLACAVWLASAASHAHAQSGGAYNLEWNTLSGGGQTFATGGAYSLGATTGQCDAGGSLGGVYQLAGGFWGGSPVPTTDVDPGSDPRPLAFAARIAGANPSRHSTAVQFDLPAARSVSVTLYAIDGRLVRRLFDGHRDSGRHTAFWDGADGDGRAVQPGMYFARVQAGEFRSTLRIVRVR